MKIYLATNNKGKIREINALFGGTHFEFVSPGELLKETDVLEDGDSYRENAYKKAYPLHVATSAPVVSEDSGMEVEALDGAPGVHSARFANLFTGKNSTDTENIQKLLSLLKEAPQDAGSDKDAGSGKRDAKRAATRAARYVSVFCFITGGQVHYFEGEVWGDITETPMGSGGFGYDPVFIPRGYSDTFAQLGPTVKNRISHRAMASQKLKDFLLTTWPR
ncbi:MAG: non-canonical purine NTP pyrophosphatase [Nitrospirae bacterium]|nr:non-canonical purine NTP pyrophosphatase [Nitrospirota bacterium]